MALWRGTVAPVQGIHQDVNAISRKNGPPVWTWVYTDCICTGECVAQLQEICGGAEDLTPTLHTFLEGFTLNLPQSLPFDWVPFKSWSTLGYSWSTSLSLLTGVPSGVSQRETSRDDQETLKAHSWCGLKCYCRHGHVEEAVAPYHRDFSILIEVTWKKATKILVILLIIKIKLLYSRKYSIWSY